MKLRPGINITRVLSFTPPAAQRIKAKLSDRRVVAEGNSTSALQMSVLPNIHRAAVTIQVKKKEEVMSPFQDEHKDRLLLMTTSTDLC